MPAPTQIAEADYDLLCANCHGAGANGGGDASIVLGDLATNLLVTADPSPLTEGENMELVRRGIPGTMIAGFSRPGATHSSGASSTTSTVSVGGLGLLRPLPQRTWAHAPERSSTTTEHASSRA